MLFSLKTFGLLARTACNKTGISPSGSILLKRVASKETVTWIISSVRSSGVVPEGLAKHVDHPSREQCSWRTHCLDRKAAPARLQEQWSRCWYSPTSTCSLRSNIRLDNLTRHNDGHRGFKKKCRRGRVVRVDCACLPGKTQLWDGPGQIGTWTGNKGLQLRHKSWVLFKLWNF